MKKYMLKKAMAILLALAVEINIMPVLMVTARAASESVTFSAESQTNIGTVLHDGTDSNDISGIQLDIFGAMTPEEATSRSPSGSFAFFSGGDFGSTDDVFTQIDETSSCSVDNEANLPRILVIMGHGGSEFSFDSIFVSNTNASEEKIKFEGFKGGMSTGSVTLNPAALAAPPWEVTFTVSDFPSSVFGDVDEVRITNQQIGDRLSGNFAGFNNIKIGDPILTPKITSAAYDAGSGVLAVTGSNMTTGDSIAVNKLTITGEGGVSYTLTTAGVELTSGSVFTVTLCAADLVAVSQLLDKNGTSAKDATAYNLAAADDWDSSVTDGDTSDTVNAVTVSGIAVPEITGANYDSSTGALAVSGRGFLKLAGAANDINVSKLTITGEGGVSYTLTTAGVELTSGTAFTVTLCAADLVAVNQLLDKNGTSAKDATAYNLAAAEGWAAGADSAVTTADLSGNGITVSGICAFACPPAADASIVGAGAREQDAGTPNTATNANGQSVTTVTVDRSKLDKILESGAENPTVTFLGRGSDVVVGELDGQSVRDMESKEAVLEIKTDTVSYTLPASAINMDAVAVQFGSRVALQNIKVSVSVAGPSADTVKIVENAADKNHLRIVVSPVDFEINCTNGDKTVTISRFNTYVERMLAIPDGVDPSGITTGIVLNVDGTFRPVPTQIVKTDGKYYAKISSLTNSTYSVVYSPLTFADAANHWAKTAINDMGSRMVATGDENGNFNPDNSITRAEFAAMVVRALGLKKGTEKSEFGDVALTDWFDGYVEAAAYYGLMTGFDARSFHPNETLTRGQTMEILSRAMKLTGLSASLTDSEINALIAKYTDGASVSDSAKSSVAMCVKTGIISGAGAAVLSPEANVTRAEAAVMIQRLLQKSGLI